MVSYLNEVSPGQFLTNIASFSITTGFTVLEGHELRVSWWNHRPELDHQLYGDEIRIAAITDLNNDKYADLLFEHTYSDEKDWSVYFSDENGFQASSYIWLAGAVTDIARGLRDFNGDGSLDLLIDSTDTSVAEPVQILQVSLNKGDHFDTGAPYLRLENANAAKIVGLEKDGLTSLARDRTDLIGWAGVANILYTHNQFRDLLADKGLTLAPIDNDPANTATPVLAQDQCTINYSQADTTSTTYNVGAKAEFGMLVCNIKIGDRASVKMQAIYGGCDATDGLYGASAKCEVGLYSAELEVDLSPAPTTTLGMKGPNAELCGGVSSSNVCANVGAELASTSASVETIGVGAGAKLAIGVGAGADFSIENGVISGSIDLKFLVGGSIEFSLDPAETGRAFYKLGETSYLFAEDAGEFVVYAAGPAIYDAASVATDGVRDVAELTSGAAVYLASEAGATAVVVFEDTGEEIGSLFVDLANATANVVDGIVDGIGGALGSVGDWFGGLW